jgi:hypothetical protein
LDGHESSVYVAVTIFYGHTIARTGGAPFLEALNIHTTNAPGMLTFKEIGSIAGCSFQVLLMAKPASRAARLALPEN